MKNNIKYKKFIILLSCISGIITNSLLNNNKKESFNYTTNDIQNMIYSSNMLSEEEKEYIYNDDFITDLLQTINENEYIKSLYTSYFNNINISTYGIENPLYETTYGYYNIDSPSTLFIKDYESINDRNKNTIAHEFVHLCQDTNGYNLIIEACAEIISYEYYDHTIMDVYAIQVKLVKMLMEIIGPYPIWNYCFTGDFSYIENSVKSYLNEEEYQEFLNDLSFDYNDFSSNIIKFDNLEKILSKLYFQKYEKDIKDDLIISLIKHNDITLSRYYFNQRKINEDNSYYYDYNNGSYKNISLQTAIDNKMIFIAACTKTSVTKNTAFKLLETNNFNISREIDLNSADIYIYYTSTGQNKMFISAVINGEKYEKVDVDDLVKKGIIDAKYYIVDMRYLTANEYLNHEYNENAQIYITHASDTIIDGNNVYGFMPQKTLLPTINERENNSLILTK